MRHSINFYGFILVDVVGNGNTDVKVVTIKSDGGDISINVTYDEETNPQVYSR